MNKFKTNCINCDKEIKTDEYFDGCICKECGGGLKTLKELEYQNSDGDKLSNFSININRLRQEAIKWVKDFRKREDEIWESDFMEFFNLTEEDLK